jgi:hypothetical protein
MPLADISPGAVLILIVLIALPIGAIVFARGAGDALGQIGRGDLSIGDEASRPDSGIGAFGAAGSASEREEEIRQMVQARSDRAVARGGEAFDVDAEVDRLLAPERDGAAADPALREEVRTLVVAKNERRARQGKDPLDVDAEVERQLRDLENLGQ